ncbi:MAG: metal ABC transporter permease [Alphaproteobacteria bacterium]|nr:metal ABC transporter permease [Alphaproteobacteria bacterium SS10]
MDDFLIRALLAGIGVALVAGPMGCFVVWRRMAYFGDTVAHASLLGVGLALILEVDLTLGVLATSCVVATTLFALQGRLQIATDTLLGILSHSALAVGLVAISLLSGLRIDLLSYLFGDILAVAWSDLVVIWGGAALLLGLMIKLWRPLLAITVCPDVAAAEGLPAQRTRLVYVLALAVLIALSMKLVGILLITSLLIIPAAAARPFAKSPEMMAMMAAGLGCLSVAGGLGASLTFDTPSGPSIVVAAVTLFILGLAIPRRRAGA